MHFKGESIQSLVSTGNDNVGQQNALHEQHVRSFGGKTFTWLAKSLHNFVNLAQSKSQ